MLSDYWSIRTSIPWPPSPCTRLSQWVGTGRTAELCLPIPPVVTVHATFTAHGDPMRGFTAFRVPLVSARLPPLWRLTGRHQCIGYFTYLSRCGPSPCDWLSQSRSTMTTLTADMGIGGFWDGFPIPYLLSIALLRIPCPPSHVH
jgi:hypothetical protein